LGLLLHLTDLHLDTRHGSGVIADTKVDVIDDESLQKRIKTIKSSLEALRLRLVQDELELDSIIITGDVTHLGQTAGFKLLPDLLAGLGEKLPANNRILVVPGNHDVLQDSKPSVRERYQGFLMLRDLGYRTAWLEGVDITAEGDLLEGAQQAPVLVAEDESFVLIGVNSSNHSNSRLQIEAELAKHLPALEESNDPGVVELLAAWKTRGAADIARVDAAQRYSLAATLRTAPPPGKAVRIAAFHHHLQPVNDVEEVKPFETMLNLGEFQDWLASNDVSVGLHGHKHVFGARSVRFVPNNQTTPHELLLICGPSLEERENNKQDIGLLLAFDSEYPRGRPVAVSGVPTMAEGTVTSAITLTPRYHHLDTPGSSGRIDGRTMVEVHQQLLSLAGNYDAIIPPLVCHIEDGASGLEIPESYPHYNGDEPIAEWFQEIVGWWQNKDRGRAAAFNHGERLYAFGFERQNQVETMVKALNDDLKTTRAVATLVYAVQDAGKEFPSFTMIHLLIKDQKLNVFAYYRKQEMPHWWPVNIAELARIQKEVLSRLSHRGISIGSITTITASPTSGMSLPRVAVPWIDREADSGRLALLVIPLFTGHRAEAALAAWRRVFHDWVPNAEEESADGSPTPVIGIRELVKEIERIEELFDESPTGIHDLHRALKEIHLLNLAYRGGNMDWSEWASLVRPSVVAALEGAESACNQG
jgi:hypothetical protein